MAYITLLSDFGLLDASVAITRGILLQYMPGAAIIDITHEVTPFNKRQGAYLLGAAYKNFPAGTFHICLIDIFSGKNPKLVIGKYNDHYFLCADNGLLPLALHGNEITTALVLPLEKTHSFHDWLHAAGNIIKSLKTGSVDTSQLPALHLTAIAENPTGSHVAEYEVIHIDAYGNAVVNFTRAMQQHLATEGRQFSMKFIQYEEIREISQNYTDVREGYKLCRFNSNGYLEIGINQGNAAELLGLCIGSKHNKIQITYK